MQQSIRMLILAALLLLSCSREDSVGADHRLDNWRIQLVALRFQPADLGVFFDSISQQDSLTDRDTLPVTVGDSVQLLAQFLGREESVRIYAWVVDGDTVRASGNRSLKATVFQNPGIHKIRFVVVDGIQGVQQSRTQFVRVVDQPPFTSFGIDTAWTASQSDGVLHLYASDSFGSIRAVWLDLRGDSNPDDTVSLSGDSLLLRVPRDSSRLDSLGNQMVRVAVVDDDGRITWDTAWVHFNSPPQVFLDYPFGNSKVDIARRFAFYYHALDGDNSKDVRYHLRVGKGSILTDGQRVAANLKESSWLAITEDGTRVLDSTLQGRLYWQVWATDGFDTSYSSVGSFWLGDPSVRFGTVDGVARMQLQSDHAGLKVSLIHLPDSGFRYLATTGTSGQFAFADVEPGFYRLAVEDTLGYGYRKTVVDSIAVEVDSLTTVDTVFLMDQSKPRVRLIQGPTGTLTTRTLSLSGIVSDSGTGIDAAYNRATLDGNLIPAAFLGGTWQVSLTELANGLHAVRIWTQDRAGNHSDTLKVSFFVVASSLEAKVQGASAALVRWDDTLQLSGVLHSAIPPAAAFRWDLNADGIWDDTTASVSDSLGLFSLLPPLTVGDHRILVEAIDDSGFSFLDTLAYTVLDAEKPSVLVSHPGSDTTITPGDSVTFIAIGGDPDGSIVQWEWDLDGFPGFEISGVSVPQAGYRFVSPGDNYIRVRVVDNDGNADTAVRRVQVVLDPPTVVVSPASDTVKINAALVFHAQASDERGSVTALDWSCGDPGSAGISFAPGVGDSLVTIAPSAGRNLWYCIVRATDDDGNQAYDTASLRVLQDLPWVKLARDTFTVTLFDSVALQADAGDSLGHIISLRWSCGLPGEAGFSWNAGPGSYKVAAPGEAASTWFCIVEAEDEDGQKVQDTARIRVLQGRPAVRAFPDSLVVTIRDTLNLDAIGVDSAGVPGDIVSWAWSCGTPGTAGQGGWIASAGPQYKLVAPSSAYSDWLCVVRVMDDDGNYASDTAHAVVLWDRPTVKVPQDTVRAKINEVLSLSASAHDTLGHIVEYAWSCGGMGVAGVSGWAVRGLDSTYTATAPASSSPGWMCVVRATDDDGLLARDTVFIPVSQDAPTVTVLWDAMDVRTNDPYDVGAVPNDSMGSIASVQWSCGGASAGTSWVYVDPADTVWTFLAPAAENLSYQCIVKVTDNDGQSAMDTTRIRVFRPPVSILQLPDSAVVWSGDVDLPRAASRWYSGVTAAGSQNGSFGTTSLRQYWWNFSHYHSEVIYQGASSGVPDTLSLQFDSAFLRPALRDTYSIRLDFRDSTLPSGEEDASVIDAFFYRHADDTVRSIRFVRAWHFLSTDTVVDVGDASSRVGLVLDASGVPVVAWKDVSGAIQVSRFPGGAWSPVGGGSPGTGDSVAIAKDSNGDLYVAFRNASGNVTVMVSAGGTGAWSLVGQSNPAPQTVSNIALAVDTVNHRPWIAFLAANGVAYCMYLQSGQWGFGGTAGATGAASSGNQVYRFIDVAISAGGDSVAFGYVRSSSGSPGNPATRMYRVSANTWNSESQPQNARSNFIDIAYDISGSLWAAISDNASSGKLSVMRRSGNSWSAVGATGFSGRNTVMQAHIVVADDGTPTVAFQDGYPTVFVPYTTVYRYQGGIWSPLGENLLPCFDKNFQQQSGYYLWSRSPKLALDGTGRPYLGMMLDDRSGSGAPNDGPTVMRYVW